MVTCEPKGFRNAPKSTPRRGLRRHFLMIFSFSAEVWFWTALSWFGLLFQGPGVTFRDPEALNRHLKSPLTSDAVSGCILSDPVSKSCQKCNRKGTSKKWSFCPFRGPGIEGAPGWCQGPPQAPTRVTFCQKRVPKWLPKSCFLCFDGHRCCLFGTFCHYSLMVFVCPSSLFLSASFSSLSP